MRIKRYAVVIPGESSVLAYAEASGILRAGKVTRRFLRRETGGLFPFLLVPESEVRRGWHPRNSEGVYHNVDAPTIPG